METQDNQQFIVSARKYRPATFDTVVGQSALTATLKNAINSGQLANAYLFCGPRGVGKTTCARIFAKTINCTDRTADGESCGKCENCKDFAANKFMYIHELDAASNNSVEDIRALIEKVYMQPPKGIRSVYIIDEVHMLSTAAFNAFLKTLEEPPTYAVFILATTEKHKVLQTIISRCQVYEFQRMTVENTISHLSMVAKNQGVEIEDESLSLIAVKADGGMRDALSIFDQVVASCGKNITYEQVCQSLGFLGTEYYFKLTNFLLNGDVKNSILVINDIVKSGFDLGVFIVSFTQHLRDLLMSRDPQTVKLLEMSAHIQEQYIETAKVCTENFLYKAMRLANDCSLRYRESPNKRLLVELTMIRICQIMTEKKKL